MAADHQSTKAITDNFTKICSDPNLSFFLGVEVGRDVTHEQLVENYHAVIYSVGASVDRELGIPGDDLPERHGAGEFVSWYNGHPDYADMKFDLSGDRAGVAGNGNVALDIARILAADPEYIDRTDIADHAMTALRASSIDEVVLLGRRGPLEAAYTTPELIGLISTPNVNVVVDAPEQVLMELRNKGTAGSNVEEDLLSNGGSRPQARKLIVLRFCSSPVEIVGTNLVTAVCTVRNELIAANDGATVARAASETATLPV